MNRPDSMADKPRWINEQERIYKMKYLSERRAKFVYDAAKLAAVAAEAPVVPAPWEEREQPFKDQFIKAITKQCSDERSTSPEEMHENWMKSYQEMGWIYGPVYDPEKKTHPDMVPYGDLEHRERDKDEVFLALCEIARLYIRE